MSHLDSDATDSANGAAAPDAIVRFLDGVRARIGTVVVGQDVVVERILIALLTSGHLLLEGVPGLAKTLLVSCLAKSIHLSFARIQFTIDLLPSDILGSEILDQRTNEFRVNKGPVFTNLLLADEINRAAPKVQSALLEAMQERKVTIGKEAFKLPSPFLVIATQNPVEQSGTFELPEAQLDRFMLRHRLKYPTRGRGARDPAAEHGARREARRRGRRRPDGVRRTFRRTGRQRRATSSRRWRRRPDPRQRHVRRARRGRGHPHAKPPGRGARGEPAGRHRAHQGGPRPGARSAAAATSSRTTSTPSPRT